jgi:hypothetical protein
MSLNVDLDGDANGLGCAHVAVAVNDHDQDHDREDERAWRAMGAIGLVKALRAGMGVAALRQVRDEGVALGGSATLRCAGRLLNS